MPLKGGSAVVCEVAGSTAGCDMLASDEWGAVCVVAEMAVENVSDGATVLSPHSTTGGVFPGTVHKVANMSDSTAGHKNECHTDPGRVLVCSDDVANRTFLCPLVSSTTVARLTAGSDVCGVVCTRCCDRCCYVSLNVV